MPSREVALRQSQRACAGRCWRATASADAWGSSSFDAAPGRARLGMVIADDMLNGFGTCHGGVLFTFADTALSCACNSRNQRSVAHHCTIVFLRPGRLGERLLTAPQSNDRSPGASASIRVDLVRLDRNGHR